MRRGTLRPPEMNGHATVSPAHADPRPGLTPVEEANSAVVMNAVNVSGRISSKAVCRASALALASPNDKNQCVVRGSSPTPRRGQFAMTHPFQRYSFTTLSVILEVSGRSRKEL